MLSLALKKFPNQNQRSDLDPEFHMGNHIYSRRNQDLANWDLGDAGVGAHSQRCIFGLLVSGGHAGKGRVGISVRVIEKFLLSFDLLSFD